MEWRGGVVCLQFDENFRLLLLRSLLLLDARGAADRGMFLFERKLNHRISQGSDALDGHLHTVAGLHGADSGGGSGGNEVAWIEGHGGGDVA